MNIIFMGTPDFAVPTLEALVNSNHTVSAVVTQTDKPVGRKQILTPPPVKETAIKYNIPCFQPQKVKGNTELFDTLKKYNPDVIVVVAYGKILPKEILNMAKFGCINSHGSLLPKYRGASPIQWSIVCGETVTGITTMQLDEGMDTGDILLQTEVQIKDNETAESLYERMSFVGANTVIKTLEDLQNGKITPIKQDDSKATYAPIINKEMALIDFTKDAKTVNNAIRGYNSWPVAFTFSEGKRLKVYSAQISGKTDKAPGTVIDNTKFLTVACGNNTSITFCEVQLEGSKRMTSDSLLKGHKIELNTILK